MAGWMSQVKQNLRFRCNRTDLEPRMEVSPEKLVIAALSFCSRETRRVDSRGTKSLRRQCAGVTPAFVVYHRVIKCLSVNRLR